MLMKTIDVVARRRTNLKAWIDEKYDGSQARFVDDTGINQGELSGLLRVKSFGEKKARALEAQAKMPPFYLDSENGEPPAKRTAKILNADNSEDFVAIKRVDFKLSAGVTGFSIEYLNGDRAPIFFRRDWIEKRGYKPESLHALPIAGQSMETSMYEGDLVVVNVDDTKPVDGEVFAVNYEGELVIKRMIREGGIWYLASDNPDKRRFPNKACHEDCFIIGRVVYKQSERI